MKYLKNNRHLNLPVFMVFLTILYVLIIYVVSTRVPELHNDSIRYAYFFRSITVEGWVEHNEWLFTALNLLASKFSSNYEIAFLFYFIVQLLGHYLLIQAIRQEVKGPYSYKIYFYFIFCLSSTWFYVSTVDGIRQGIALPYLYLSTFFFYKRCMLKSLLSFLVSISFHVSGLLILPFIILLKFRSDIIFMLFLMAAILYPIGVNEFIVRFISESTGVPIYSMIVDYANGTLRYYGFDPFFFVYTVFFGILFYSYPRVFKSNYENVIFILADMYLVFSIYYFVFGFAAFSNRYAFAPWNFIPVVVSVLFIAFSERIDANKRFLLYFIVSIISIFIFLSKFSVFWVWN